MTHGDDRGLRLPPAVAPVQVVIVPIYRSDDERGGVLVAADKAKAALSGNGIRVKIDDRDQHRPGFKFSEWELKGVPIRIEIGPRDVEADQVIAVDRVSGQKQTLSSSQVISQMAGLLNGVQRALYDDALAFRETNTHPASDYGSLTEGLDAEGGFWAGSWCGALACEEKVSTATSATIRLLPIEAEDPGGPCTVCGQPGTEQATWAKAY